MEKTIIFMLIVATLFAFNMQAEECGIDVQSSVGESYRLGHYDKSDFKCIFSQEEKIFVSR